MNELKLDEITIGDRYQVRGRISTGSYAEVFVARDLKNDGCEVVIKALNTDLQGTPDVGLEQTLTENFAKEASILESIFFAAPPLDVRKGSTFPTDYPNSFEATPRIDRMIFLAIAQRCRQFGR